MFTKVFKRSAEEVASPPTSFPCSPVPILLLTQGCRERAAHRELQGLLGCTEPMWQSIRAWRTPRQAESAACCKAATLERLCPPSLLQQESSPWAAPLPWGTSIAAAGSGQGDLVPAYSLHTLQSLSRQAGGWETPWHVWTEPPAVTGAQHEGKQVVHAGDVNQEETVPVKILIPACLGLQDERGHLI